MNSDSKRGPGEWESWREEGELVEWGEGKALQDSSEVELEDEAEESFNSHTQVIFLPYCL